MFCLCFYCALVPTVYTSNSVVFLNGSAKIFLPLGAGYSSYANAYLLVFYFVLVLFLI